MELGYLTNWSGAVVAAPAVGDLLLIRYKNPDGRVWLRYRRVIQLEQRAFQVEAEPDGRSILQGGPRRWFHLNEEGASWEHADVLIRMAVETESGLLDKLVRESISCDI